MSIVQSLGKEIWALAASQHWVVTRTQLLDLGLTRSAIDQRIRSGRLHPLWRGAYAVGRPHVDAHGRWMAAVLACGPGAALSHRSAAALWGIRPIEAGPIEITMPLERRSELPGIRVHRRRVLDSAHLTSFVRIPVTVPAVTLVDIARSLTLRELEAAANEADKLDRIDPEALRLALDDLRGWPGVPRLRGLLDRLTFTLTDSDLERLFLPVVRRCGLPLPRTQVRVNGFRVDFHWPELGLVVETDGLRYHRTPAQQRADRRRDQAHLMAGTTPLRFTHSQIAFERRHVQHVLGRIAGRLSGG